MKSTTALAGVAGAALVSLYFRSLWLVAAQGFLANASTFQIGMILLQSLKLLVILSVKRLREANMLLVFDVFSLELLSLPFLVVAYLLSGYAPITGFEYGLFSTWPLGLALVFVPFAAFRVVRAMLRDGLLSSVFPGAVLVAGLAVFSAQAVSTPAAQAGSADFTKDLVGGIVSSAGRISPLGLDPVTAVSLTVLFLCVVLYAAVGRAQPEAGPGPALTVALLSSLLVLGWTVSVVGLPGAILYFALPTLMLVAAVWWSGREK